MHAVFSTSTCALTSTGQVALDSLACQRRHKLFRAVGVLPQLLPSRIYEMTETETKDCPCAQAFLQLCRNIARLCESCGTAGPLKDCREGRRGGRVRCRGMHSRSHITFRACGKGPSKFVERTIAQVNACCDSLLNLC